MGLCLGCRDQVLAVRQNGLTLNTRLSKRHTAVVLTFSRIARDRRVLRQCDLLTEMGWDLSVIAYSELGDAIAYPLMSWPQPHASWTRRAKTAFRQLPAHFGAWAARIGFWSDPRNRWALNRLERLKPYLIVANDWPALVVAAAYKSTNACYIHYDTHEFSTLEFDERWIWRVLYKPFVVHLEKDSIGSADSISTVGPFLSASLQDLYQLKDKPTVVRNIPDSIDLSSASKTSWPLRVLYHGQLLPDRGLEALIMSIADWHEPHRLTIRGDGPVRYVDHLKRMVAGAGFTNQISFENAVLPDQVMPIAALTADLGVHFTPLDTVQRHFSLPNKLFEYIGSGLAVAVSPGADLRAVVEEHGVGAVSSDASPQAIAAVINSLTFDQVVKFKSAARNAARQLCWSKEREALRNVLAPLVPSV